jgi:hypothetical protein
MYVLCTSKNEEGIKMANPNPSPRTRFTVGNTVGRQFRPGSSGNPRGISHKHYAWRAAYADALIEFPGGTEQAAAEVAQKLWELVREKKPESWAVRELIEGLGGPQALQVNMQVGRGKDEEQPDYSALTNVEFEELGRLLAKASCSHAGELESGESAEKPR